MKSQRTISTAIITGFGNHVWRSLPTRQNGGENRELVYCGRNYCQYHAKGIVESSDPRGVNQLVVSTPILSQETRSPEKGSQQALPSALSSRGQRFYATERKVKLSEDLMELTIHSFPKLLSRGAWKALTKNYPVFQGRVSFLVAPHNGDWYERGHKKKSWLQ